MNIKKPTTVALVTYKNFLQDCDATLASKECPGLTNADNALRTFLEDNHMKCIPLAWDDTSNQLDKFDIFIIRTTWNYYHSMTYFNQFLEFLHNIPSRVYNSFEVIKWNCNKRYLQDLQKMGIPIVPTLFHTNMENNILDHINMFRNVAEEVVIKPCISGAGRNTYKFDLRAVDNYQLLNIKHKLIQAGITEIMLQPFISTIMEKGELSLVFFQGNFSHAVRRMPVITSFGASVPVTKVRNVSLKALKLAIKTLTVTYKILSISQYSLLYARVDLLVNSNNEYLVSELELIEPDLFFEYDRRSVRKFGNAIMTTLLGI